MARGVSPAARWLRRAAYLAGFLLWLAIMCLPLFAFVLAVKGEMTWKRGEFAEDRLWLIQEIEQRGLGYSAARVVSDERARDGPVCVRTRVRFFMWQGEAEPAGFCECYTAGAHEPIGNCR